MSRIKFQVAEFHAANGIPVLPKPQVPTDDRIRLRAVLIIEEVMEFCEACWPDSPGDWARIRALFAAIVDKHTPYPDLVEVADALADIAYVVEGTNLEYGIDSEAVLEEVHRANMAKVGGPVREDGKRLKPEGWTPPDIAGVLEKQR